MRQALVERRVLERALAAAAATDGCFPEAHREFFRRVPELPKAEDFMVVTAISRTAEGRQILLLAGSGSFSSSQLENKVPLPRGAPSVSAATGRYVRGDVSARSSLEDRDWKALDAFHEVTAKLARPFRRQVKYAQPKYVRACRDGGWHMRYVEKETGAELLCPFHCDSWRHAGPCGERRAGEDARRLREGIEKLGAPMAFVVLTFGKNMYKLTKGEAYRAIYRQWTRLRKRIARRWGDFEFAATIEQHRSGYPHMNVILSGFLAQCVEFGNWRQARNLLAPMALACNFGLRLWVDEDLITYAIAGYLAKYATKENQAPVDAPQGFRRLRASRGFLGPRKASSGKFTGELKCEPVPDVQQLQEESDARAVRRVLYRQVEDEARERDLLGVPELRVQRDELLLAGWTPWLGVSLAEFEFLRSRGEVVRSELSLEELEELVVQT